MNSKNSFCTQHLLGWGFHAKSVFFLNIFSGDLLLMPCTLWLFLDLTKYVLCLSIVTRFKGLEEQIDEGKRGFKVTIWGRKAIKGVRVEVT